jgi:hypothetical protein
MKPDMFAPRREAVIKNSRGGFTVTYTKKNAQGETAALSGTQFFDNLERAKLSAQKWVREGRNLPSLNKRTTHG